MSKGISKSSTGGDALKELLIEATYLHHHVAAASRQLASTGDLTNGQVSLLRSIARDGPQTVPQLAGERAIARQPVQRMTGELRALDLVRLEPNPRHRRSRLIALTPRGQRRLASMERRQSSWVRRFQSGVSERSVRAATRVLRRIREEINNSAPLKGTRS
jgi:DNA-binding MarR family transcriptional regulator